jgi:hypothetical protein
MQSEGAKNEEAAFSEEWNMEQREARVRTAELCQAGGISAATRSMSLDDRRRCVL